MPKKEPATITASRISGKYSLIGVSITAVVFLIGSFLVFIATSFGQSILFPVTMTPSLAPVASLFPPSNTPVPNATMLIAKLPFTDDFENGINPLWQGDRDNWTSRDGKAIIANSLQAKLLMGNPDWKNYTINVDVTSSESKFTSYLSGVIVRYQDKQNYVQFILNCDFSNPSYISWIYYQNGIKNEVGEKPVPCQSYRIKIVVNDSVYTANLTPLTTPLNVNPEYKISKDLSFSNGLIGILSADNGGNGVAAFDNFSVSP